MRRITQATGGLAGFLLTLALAWPPAAVSVPSDQPLQVGGWTSTTGVEGQMVFPGDTNAALAIYEGDWCCGGPGGDTDVSAGVDWGDGASEALSLSPGEGDWRTPVPAHSYAEEGTYTVTLVLADADGETTRIPVTATIADAPLSVSAVPVAVAAGTVDGPLATFTDANPGAPASDETASVDWGDGARTPGVIQATGGKYVVLGRHTYTHSGAFTMRVSVADRGGASASVAEQARVAPEPGAAAPHTGRARLRHLPGGCVSENAVVVAVSGVSIARVAFRLDGRRRRGRTVTPGVLYRARIALPAGRHELSVRVVFAPGSHTHARRFHRVLTRCRA